MKSLRLLCLMFLALSLVNTKPVFAEAVSHKCLSSNEMVQSLADEEICSDLDLTNEDKLSTCLQRKYMSAKNNLDDTYTNIVAPADKNQTAISEGKAESEIDHLLSLFKKKPVLVSGFVEEKPLNSIARDSQKRDELIKEQTAWNESLLYDCMDAAKQVENDPYPLLVIKGCLVGMTEERITYLNALL